MPAGFTERLPKHAPRLNPFLVPRLHESEWLPTSSGGLRQEPDVRNAKSHATLPLISFFMSCHGLGGMARTTFLNEPGDTTCQLPALRLYLASADAPKP